MSFHSRAGSELPSHGDSVTLKNQIGRYILNTRIEVRWVCNSENQADCIQTDKASENNCPGAPDAAIIRIFQQIKLPYKAMFDNGTVGGFLDEVSNLARLKDTHCVLNHLKTERLAQLGHMQCAGGYLVCILLDAECEVGNLRRLGDIEYDDVAKDPKYRKAMLRALRSLAAKGVVSSPMDWEHVLWLDRINRCIIPDLSSAGFEEDAMKAFEDDVELMLWDFPCEAS